jgi:hypothetical protein
VTASSDWSVFASDAEPDEPDDPDEAETPNRAITMVVTNKARKIAKARCAVMRKSRYFMSVFLQIYFKLQPLLARVLSDCATVLLVV